MKLSLALLALAIVPSGALAQAPDPCATAPASCATLIATHASSESRIANTAVDISVSVTALGRDMAEVQRTLATKSNQLLAYLKAQKVDRLMTAHVSFTPETRYEKNAPEKTVGYKGTSSVSFRTTPDKAGDLLAGVLTNGANEIGSTTFTPTEQEVAEARQRLLEEATHTALTEAEAIARAAGMHVVSVRNINVNDEPGPRPMLMDRVMELASTASSVPMQTSAGDQNVVVRVNVTAAATR